MAHSETASSSSKGPKSKEARSSTKFPYSDLDEAIKVAQAIHTNAGTECNRDQLAAFLSSSPKSGTFRLQIATANHFGLVTSSQGKVKLTELGREILDPNRERQARVKAFYNIPLYKQIYEKYQGHPLPPARGLEETMVRLGVSAKQTGKARQAFQRSATQAGFFAYMSDRLVEPIGTEVVQEAPPDDHAAEVPAVGSQRTDLRVENSVNYHPFIEGLIGSLPEPHQSWDTQGQVRWLQTAAHIFGLLYNRDEEIIVTVKKGSTSNEDYG